MLNGGKRLLIHSVLSLCPVFRRWEDQRLISEFYRRLLVAVHLLLLLAELARLLQMIAIVLAVVLLSQLLIAHVRVLV